MDLLPPQPRLLTSQHMVDRVMHRKPSFRRYDWLRWLPPYRYLRAAYIRWTRRRWQRDDANWRYVPKKSILRLPNGDFLMHSAIKHEIEKVAGHQRFRAV